MRNQLYKFLYSKQSTEVFLSFKIVAVGRISVLMALKFICTVFVYASDFKFILNNVWLEYYDNYLCVHVHHVINYHCSER